MGLIESTIALLGGRQLSLYDLYRGTTSPVGSVPANAGSGRAVSTTPGERFASLKSVLYPHKMTWERTLDFMDEMDSTGLASSVIDMVTDDICSADDAMKSLELTGRTELVNEAKAMFERVGLEENLYEAVRQAVLYGNSTFRVGYATGKGVTSLTPVPVRFLKPSFETETLKIVGYSEQGRKYRNGQSAVSWPWDYWNIKMTGKTTYAPWGTPFLFHAIRSWTQMVLADDSALLYRLTRTPDRLLFMLDVGSGSEADAEKMVREFRQRLKKKLGISASSIAQEHEPWGVMDDIIMAKRTDSTTEVRPLPGSSPSQGVTDLQHFTKGFLNDAGVPLAVFGYNEGELGESSATKTKKATNQDYRYAKRIRRRQKDVTTAIAQLIKLNNVLLAKSNTDPLLDFKPRKGKPALVVSLRPASYLEEMEQADLLTMRADIAAKYMAVDQMGDTVNKRAQVEYCLRHVYRLPDSEVAKWMSRSDKVALSKPSGEKPEAETGVADAALSSSTDLSELNG